MTIKRGSRLLAAAALVVVTGVSAAGAARAPAVELPTGISGRQGRLVLAAANAGQFGVVENHAAGTVIAREDVRVEVGPDGAVSPVQMVQTLQVPGPGDYILEVPSGATDAVGRPGSANDPGLREGTVLWEGFSGRRERLAADVTLGKGAADRFPLRVSSRTDGDDVTLTLGNATAIGVPYKRGDVAAGSLGAALDAVRRGLAGRGALRPGRRGIPQKLPALGPLQPSTVTAEVPVHVTGTVSFGGKERRVDVTLPSADAPDGRLRLRGPKPIEPDLKVTLVPAAPRDVPELAPGADAAARRAALDGLVRVLGRWYRQQDYLPLVPGPVTARYSATFAVAAGEPAATPAPAPPAPPPPPANLAIVAVAMAALVATGGAVWRQL